MTPEVPFTVDGFIGCRDQRNAKFAPGEMLSIFNMMPETRDRPSPLLCRLGYKRFTGAGGGTAAGVAGNVLYAIDGYIGLSSYFSLIITSTGFWKLDIASGTVTLVLPTANIVAAGAAIANFAHAIFFNGKLVVADANTKPWTWDGTTNGGVSVLANASSGVTMLAAYAGKLVTLTSVLPSGRVEWSEEGDETIGYATAPYSNFWTLRQTGQSPLVAIVGTNDGLFYFRKGGGGIGAIRGEVDEAFSTTATRDEVSSKVGAYSLTQFVPALPSVGEGGCVMFFDQFGRPMLYRPGRGLVWLWKQAPRLFGLSTGRDWDRVPWGFDLSPGDIDLTGSVASSCYYDKVWQCHAFHIQAGGIGYVFLFDDQTDSLVSIWTTPLTGGFLTFLELSNNSSTLFPAQIKIDNLGFVYWQDNREFANTSRSWSDEVSGGVGAVVVGTIIGPPHGHNQRLDYWFDEAHILVEARASHSVSLAWVSAAAHKGSLGPVPQTFAEAGLTNTPYERRVEFGLPEMAPARWLMPQWQVFAAAAADQQPKVFGYSIVARPDAAGVGTK